MRNSLLGTSRHNSATASPLAKGSKLHDFPKQAIRTRNSQTNFEITQIVHEGFLLLQRSLTLKQQFSQRCLKIADFFGNLVYHLTVTGR